MIPKHLLRLCLLVILCLLAWQTAVAQTEPTTTPLDPEAAVFIESQSSPVVYLRYDVYLTLLTDGQILVREIQEVYFKESFRTAFADIPAVYTTGIQDIHVSQEGQPYTFVAATPMTPSTYTVVSEDGNYYVEWRYEPTQPGDIRTFTLEYTIDGGLWVYETGDILEWRAVAADRGGVPVYASQVTLTLPDGMTPLQTNAFGPLFTTNQQNNQTIFEASEPLLDGTAFQVMVTFLHGLVTADIQDWQIVEDTADLQYRITGLQQELEITPEGAILVTEQQQVAVEAGALYSGYKRWNLANLDAIADLQLYEGEQLFSLDEQGCDYCFRAVETERALNWAWADRTTGDLNLDVEKAGSIDLTWTVPPLVRGETTNFTLLYEAQGVLQITSENQQLAWTVVSGYDVPVETAEVVVTFPPGISLENSRVEGGRLQLRENGRVAILHDGPIPAEGSWQIRLTLPTNATTANKPAWQTDIEQAIARGEAIREANRQAEIRQARTQLGFAAVGGVILLGGLLGVLALWYVWGRDETAVAVPTYLAEPPSNLPPGIVAYLLTEQPTPKGALASLFHLATLGLLRLDFTHHLSLVSNWNQPLNPDQQLETPSGQTVTIPKHLVTLFNALLPHLSTDHQRPISLDAISYEFTKALPQVYYQMGQEATQFFAELPAVARHRWLSWGQWLVLAALGVSACLWLTLLDNFGQVVFAPPLALAVVGGVLMLVSRWMPQRTEAGAEEAAKWQAFREYLKNLKTYGGEVQPILDRYFAYAVALDLENVVLKQVETMGGRPPVWTRSVSFIPRQMITPSLDNQPLTAHPPTLLQSDTPDEVVPFSRPEGNIPEPLSLAGISQQLTNGLEQASRNLTGVLNTAVGDLGETPFKLVIKGVTAFTWNTTSTALDVMGEILDSAASGDEGGGYGDSSGYSGGQSGSHRSSWSSSRSSSASSRRSSSSSFSGRSSSSRRSGGGGSRGFKR